MSLIMNIVSFTHPVLRMAWLAISGSIAGCGTALMFSGCDSSKPLPVSATTEASPESLTSDGQTNLMPPPMSETRAMELAGNGQAPLAAQGTEAGEAADEASAGDSTSSNNSASPRPAGDGIDLAQRAFMTLQPLTTTSPATLIDHLRQIDAALQDLVLAGSSNFLDEQTFKQAGL